MLATIKGGALGGGTVDSLLGFKDISRDERRAASHPYGLNPPDKRRVAALRTAAPALAAGVFGRWMCPIKSTAWPPSGLSRPLQAGVIECFLPIFHIL